MARQASEQAADSAVELRGITKAFGGFVANDAIDLAVRRGEVHCLLGENGAGKTTLMNILYGQLRPDAGEIRIGGRPVVMRSPADAIAAGIGMVHQHFMLVDRLSVAENVVLGYEPRGSLGVFPAGRAAERVADLSRRYGLAVDPRAAVEDLPLGARQRVEILKALHREADILILDEPTAVLTPPEVEELYRVIAALRANGKTVVFITHKLKETMAISDRVTVLKAGRVVGTVETARTSPPELARMMVGREVLLRLDKQPARPGEVLLAVRDLHVRDARGHPALRGVTFAIRAGEIYGIAGIEGNGQTELIEAITGLRPIEAGQVLLDGQPLETDAAGMLARGLGHVPEDRLRRGLVPQLSVAENAILGYHHQPRFARGGLLRWGAIRDYARRLVHQYDIRLPSESTAAGRLSGGNQQKVVVGRVFSQDPRALVVAQPTRGLDVGAIEYIHRRILELRDAGKAILFISADLDEVRALSDRLAVLHEGRIVHEGPVDELDEAEIGLLMAGGRAEARA